MLPSLLLVAGRAAAILAVVLVALRVLRRARPATRRSLLVAAFAIVLVLPIITAALPALHLRGPDSGPELASTAASSTADPIDADSIAPPVAISAAPARATGARSEALSPRAIAIAVWAAGVLVVLSRLAVGLVRARRLVRAAQFVETFDFAGRPVEVRISGTVDTPSVTGLFVPVVLLPANASSWSAERRRVVLAHELAHVAHHDCLANAIAQLAVALHWFDPLIWIAARRLRIERELAADDHVIAGGVIPSTYAEHLLALATTGHLTPQGALAMAEPAQLSTRIQSLLATRTDASVTAKRLVAAGIVTLTAFVACATPEADVPAIHPAATAPLDKTAQAIADQELDRMTKDWSPTRAIVLVMDPHTGTVVAASSRGGGETSAAAAATRPIIIGSTVKPLVVAAALDAGSIAPSDRFDASPQPNATIEDSEPHGMLDVGEILAVSSNVGISKIVGKLDPGTLAAGLERFHLPATPPDAVSTGSLASTPLDMAAAYGVLADGGIYHAPSFAAHDDAGQRIIRADTAATTLALLEGVTGDHGTGKAARVDGVRVAGKTGTSRTYASFIGIAPLDQPRYVVFVGAESPRDGGSGGQVAAPVFSRVMTRLLAR